MKHHLIETSIPNEVTRSLRRHFHWVKSDRMDDLIRSWIDQNKDRNMLVFDLSHDIFGFIRKKITERNHLFKL